MRIWRMMGVRLFRLVLLAAAPWTVTACGDDPAGVPVPARTVTVVLPGEAMLEGDMASVSAVVRDRGGTVIPDAPVTWSVNDAALVEITPDGTLLALRPGTVTVTATHEGVSASRSLTIGRLVVEQVTIVNGALHVALGDVVVLGIRVRGQGGRNVLGRQVTITSDNPAIAAIDAAGRVRGVSTGTTTIRATADGVTGTAAVEVTAEPVLLPLLEVDGKPVPSFVEGDSVVWDDVREYHELYISAGELRIIGGPQPRYEVTVRYAQYNVTLVGGERVLELRMTSRLFDRGTVQYDARGDLMMTSEVYYPLSHTATAHAAGYDVRFRLPGEDKYLMLMYRRDGQ